MKAFRLVSLATPKFSLWKNKSKRIFNFVYLFCVSEALRQSWVIGMLVRCEFFFFFKLCDEYLMISFFYCYHDYTFLKV